MSQALDQIADRYFAAIEQNDIAALEDLYSDDYRLWHSFDNQTKDRATCLALIGGLGHVATKKYRLIESMTQGDRVARRYELTLNSPDRWADHKMNLVFFLTIRGEQIVSMEEYVDSRDAADAMAAVEAAGRC